MNDIDVQTKITHIKDHIKSINEIIAELHNKKVDIGIMYQDNVNTRIGNIPQLKLWKALQVVDYNKDE